MGEVLERLNNAAAYLACLDDGKPEQLEEFISSLQSLLSIVPADVLTDLVDIISSAASMVLGTKSFSESYPQLSKQLELLIKKVEKHGQEVPGEIPPAAPPPGNLSMDIAVLTGLAEEMESDPRAAEGMRNIVRRIAGVKGLHPALASAVSVLDVSLEEASPAGKNPSAPEMVRQSLSVLEKVVERLASSGGDDPAGEEGIRQDDLIDTDHLEASLQKVEELEEALLRMENDDQDARLEAAACLLHLGGFCEKASFHRAGEILRKAADLLRSLEHAELHDGVDFLLELKDLLELFLGNLLSGEKEDSFSARAAEILEKLSNLLPDSMPEKGKKSVPPPLYLQLPDDELEIQDFLAEAPEYIQSVEWALMELEKDPKNPDHLNEAFRGFHNLKGSAGFLKLKPLVDLSHAAESLLEAAREGRVVLAGPYFDLAFEALDNLKNLVKAVEATPVGRSRPLPPHFSILLERLQKGATGESPGPAKDTAASGEPRTDLAAGKAEGEPGDFSFRRQKKQVSGKADSLVKVSTRRLDNLIDAVGELVIAHSMVMQEKEIAETRNSRLARNLSQLTKIIRELQELAMGMRMVSLKSTFQKMARLARDLSTRSGIPLDFSYHGEETEIDRNLVEEIYNPLVHLVRNAVDHGLESPEERRRKGKPERGRIRLRGYHEGGNVVIELEDDGRGIDTEGILQKAVRMKIVNEGEAKRLSTDEIHRLIFHDGLSTAERVTEVSGRGVGMGVVKNTVEKLRGRVDIHSRPGKGTLFTIRLPLTLAIIDGMVVRVADQEYVIPSIAIHSSFQPQKEQVHTVAGKGEMISLRGQIIPLFRLNRLFGMEGAKENPWEALALVMGENGDRCAVLVDDIVGQQQVVIKSLGDIFARLPGIAGGAVMGSGKVALILDPQGLIQAARSKRAG